MVSATFIEPMKQVLLQHKPDFTLANANQICEEFPCFHAAFVMKAILLKDDAPSFEESLPQIAVRVLDRALLYDQIHTKYFDSSKEILEKVSKTETALVQTLEKEAKIEEESLLSESASKDLADLANLAKDLKKKKTAKKPVKAVAQETLLPNKEDDKVKKQVSQKVEPKPENLSFIQWLQHKKSIEKQKEVVNKVEKFPIDMVASNEAELMMEVKKSALPLEDFIVNQIEKKQEKRAQNDMPNFYLVSETYAQILADQGKILEAIQVYKELSIKYPKKSSNFARQIENLKNSL